MAGFAAAERRWIERLGGLRNTIRQEVIARQLEGRIAAGSVFNDAVASDTAVPGDAELAALLDAEERAGRTDPYRWMASQLHVLASRVQRNG